jgi:hypothetical protein
MEEQKEQYPQQILLLSNENTDYFSQKLLEHLNKLIPNVCILPIERKMFVKFYCF